MTSTTSRGASTRAGSTGGGGAGAPPQPVRSTMTSEIRRALLDDSELDAAVLRLAFGRVVAGDRPREAVAPHRHAARIDAVGHHPLEHRLRAAPREIEVVRRAALVVGVTADLDADVRVVAQRVEPDRQG